MDHDVVVGQKMTERYLLNELDPEVRDEFEEHFFDCPVCALDVRAGAMFVEQSKLVLADKPAEASAPHPAPVTVRPGWFGWFRPAFAVPVMALLLAVIGYQNLVMYPRLAKSLNAAGVSPYASVNIGTWGSEPPVVSARPGEGFVINPRIPPEGGYSYYAASLYNPAGILEWSGTIPATSGKDQYVLKVPGTNRAAGRYTLTVHGVTAAGESKDIGQASFELQILK
ncbi:MAG TPA: zf-HC2 domain-containing protein [Candidatus Sulfotelmatobacter sp.]|nr:zf-HC2 domain-containing protein [Candidatus Sulfotelmatobacter sp.]